MSGVSGLHFFTGSKTMLYHERGKEPDINHYALEIGFAEGESKAGAFNQRFISTGSCAFSSTWRVVPPRMSWRRREAVE